MTDRNFPVYVQTRGFDANLREVCPGVWVGGHRARLLRGWGSIVDLVGVPGDQTVPTLSLPMRDGDRFPPERLDAITDFVGQHHPRGPVLIHCRAGFSRSVSAAYAVCRRAGFGHDESLRRTRSRDADPDGATFDSARRWADSRGY